MLPKSHGGRLVQRLASEAEHTRLLEDVRRLPRVDLNAESASDVWNIGIGAYSPLGGFLRPEDLRAVLYEKHLASGVPWTIPIVLDVSSSQANQLGEAVGLWYAGQPLALLEVETSYRYDPLEFAKQVFGTEDQKHPGVAKVFRLQEVLLAGGVTVLGEMATPFARYP